MKYPHLVDWTLSQHLHTVDGRTLLGHDKLWLDLGALLEGPETIRSALISANSLRVRATIPDVNHTTFHLDAFSPPAHLKYFFQSQGREGASGDAVAACRG